MHVADADEKLLRVCLSVGRMNGLSVYRVTNSTLRELAFGMSGFGESKPNTLHDPQHGKLWSSCAGIHILIVTWGGSPCQCG